MQSVFIFDIDDTMYDQQSAFGKAIHSLDIPNNKILDISHLYQLMKEYGDETFSLGFDKTKLKQMHIYRIKRSLLDYDVEITDAQAIKFQMNFDKYQDEIQLFPTMDNLLDVLVKKNQILGIITNGTYRDQSKKIEQLNLEKWFPRNNIVISEELGISKPNKDIFQYFERKISLPSKIENFYYIGDNYLNDIVGPKTVGWNTIWVNYRNYQKPKACLADYIVETPDELSTIISKIIFN
ncbi:HAD family hydrolase [Enterococcus faecium]|uniref:HAD family hydrolase n=1 Tax=Enterococcus faecium TaxID=1352 RepID=UPI0034A4DF2A